MTDSLFVVLDKQLELKRLEQKRAVARTVALLDYLSPVFVRHLRFVEDEGQTLFMRAFVKELKRCNHSFASLMGICNSAADFDYDEFQEFHQTCALLASLDMTTDSSQKFWESYLQTQNCEMCERGHRAHALSAAVMLEPFPIEFCLEIGHQSDLCYSHFVEPMWNSLDALVPA